MAFNINNFANEAKPLPVFLLLDVSGSMYGDKINQLNNAVEEMIASFKNTSANGVRLQLCAVTFSNNANVTVKLQDVEQISWQAVTAGGGTNLTDALIKTKELIENRDIVPSRAYRPAVILVSDGYPNSGWQSSMNNFIDTGRSSKCQRMSMLIGDRSDQAVDVMRSFLRGSGNDIYFAKDASEINKFFKFAGMSITSRTNSKNPEDTVNLQPFGPANTIVCPEKNVQSNGSANGNRVAATTVIIKKTDDDDEE